MIRYSKLLIALFFSVITLSSCTEKKDPPFEPATEADIMGFVHLYDDGTHELDSDGMKVTIEGSSPILSETTIIDNNDDYERGVFTFVDLTYGTYTLIYEKDGYGTFKKFNIDHSYSDLNPPTILRESPSLGQISTTTISNLVVDESGVNPTLHFDTNPENGGIYRYFLSSSPDVSSEKYSFYSKNIISGINPSNVEISKEVLIAAGFSRGDKVYVIVYGDSYFSNDYEDPDLGRRVFPNVNSASETKSFIFP